MSTAIPSSLSTGRVEFSGAHHGAAGVGHRYLDLLLHAVDRAVAGANHPGALRPGERLPECQVYARLETARNIRAAHRRHRGHPGAVDALPVRLAGKGPNRAGFHPGNQWKPQGGDPLPPGKICGEIKPRARRVDRLQPYHHPPLPQGVGGFRSAAGRGVRRSTQRAERRAQSRFSNQA